jgi:hypothetical protein
MTGVMLRLPYENASGTVSHGLALIPQGLPGSSAYRSPGGTPDSPLLFVPVHN